jgi:hypothetical protein
MRKRYLLVLIIIALVGVSFVIYYLTLSKLLSSYNEPQNQENGTTPPNILPFRFPWEAPQTTTNKSSSGGAGGSGGGSGGSGNGGAGGSGGGEGTEETYYIPKASLSLDSIPEGLKIFASYYINNVRHSITSYAPFNLEIDVNSLVCVLPAYVIGNGTLKWTLDEQDCPFSVCETPSYSITETLYSDYGCLINMNSNRSVTLNYTQT